MKIIPLLIFVSLTTNLMLAVTLWRRNASALRADEITAPQTKSALSSSTASTDSATSSPPKPSPLWTGLKSDAIGDAIARLRAAGCPPREIAAAAEAMIDNLRREKIAALGYANNTLPYWKQFQRFDAPRPPNELNELGMETQRLRRIHLLSPELYAANEELVAADRHRYGNLDTEKLRRLAIIDKETAERWLAGLSGSAQPGESRYPESKPNASEEIERQKTAAVMATLTADEYAQYELRNSPVASMLRNRLGPFRPTEEEYKALFAIEKAGRAQMKSGTPTAEQQQAARAQYEADVLAALGPERAADLDALQNAGSNLLPRLIARLDLPLVTVSVLNTVRNETDAQAKAIMNDQQLSPAQRTEQLNALAQEAENRLGSALGSQRAVDAYKDLKGEWLRTLRQSAAPGR